MGAFSEWIIVARLNWAPPKWASIVWNVLCMGDIALSDVLMVYLWGDSLTLRIG